jgi:preprotein translocase subunit SecG
MGAFMSGRGTANLLTRTTAILGTLFFGISLSLALLNKGTSVTHDILAVPPPPAAAAKAPGAPVTTPVAPVRQAPRVPTK